MLFLYDPTIAMLARRGSESQSALDFLAKEHSQLRDALHDLAASSTAESRQAALNNFICELDRHEKLEEIKFFNALTEAYPTRLAPQILIFRGNHWPIKSAAFEMLKSVDEASFAGHLATLTTLLENHIREDEGFFPEILRVAGYDLLLRMRYEM
jgi:hypothetical protein